MCAFLCTLIETQRTSGVDFVWPRSTTPLGGVRKSTAAAAVTVLQHFATLHVAVNTIEYWHQGGETRAFSSGKRMENVFTLFFFVWEMRIYFSNIGANDALTRSLSLSLKRTVHEVAQQQ